MADDKKNKKQEEVQEQVVQNTEVEEMEAVEQEQSECEVKLEKAEAQVEEYKTQYLRALADYQNYERRVREEQASQRDRVKADVINKLLPFLDNLEKAEMFIKDPGLKMIKDQFMQTITQLGVEELDLEGKEFDPNVAEGIELVEGDKDNIIVKVSRKAYTLNGAVIQHGLVSVSKKK